MMHGKHQRTVEINYWFGRLQLEDREPDELWNDIRDKVKDTADKKLSEAKRKEVSKWLSDEAVEIADNRRKALKKSRRRL